MPSPFTIQDLTDAIGGIDGEIRGLDERKAELQRQRGALVTTLRYFGGDAPDPPAATSGGNSLNDAIFAVLSEESPLHRRVIHNRVVERGVSVGGRDPVSNVTAHMSADPRFHSIGGGMWDFVNPPTTTAEEPSDYDTQDEEEEDNVPW